MKKFPKRILGTDSNGVVYFFEREKIEQYYTLIKKVVTQVFD